MKRLRDIPVKEKDLSKAIRTALEILGCRCYSTEQGYRKSPGGTRTTAGIPDLLVMHEHSGAWTFAELKVGKRKLTPAQEAFREVCRRCDIPHAVWRSVAEALEWREGVWGSKGKSQ